MENNIDILEEIKTLTLLYVEDDIQTQELTLTVLEDIFDNIIVASNGKEALEAFATNHIDLIITDINMPVLDGLSMSKEIKKLKPSTPIIVLTAMTDISVIKEAIDIDIDIFLSKPLYDIDILIHKLKKIITKINYDNLQKEMVKIEQEKEKINAVYNIIKTISHHWKQPLSIISTISSTFVYKVENNIELNKQDFENLHLIAKKTQELSDVLSKIENINIDLSSMKEIEKFITISKPLYKDNI